MAPDVLDEAEGYLSAFWELCTDRPAGMTLGPIPFTSIDRYASRFGIDDPDEFDQFRKAIRACDEAWLAHRQEVESA